MNDLAIVAARELHSYYGASHILHGIDFSVRPAEVVGLMGRNGMGKTTLIRTLLGLVPARRGELHIDGKVMTNAAPHRIARLGIAYVPEGRGIFPNLTVRENLLMAARPSTDGQTPWSLDRVLETFPRLADRLSHGGQQLSGGEQQMLSIGRALMTNPRLLMLDEATEGLAPLVREEIWSCLTRLKAAGQSILVIDKNVEALTRIADRHYLIERGRVVWSGSSAELAAAPQVQHQYLGI